VTLVRSERVAWTFYIELLLPLLVCHAAPAGARCVSGPHGLWRRAKIGSVAALGLVLDGGFLRSPARGAARRSIGAARDSARVVVYRGGRVDRASAWTAAVIARALAVTAVGDRGHRRRLYSRWDAC
jgi:hypothetical protein